MFMISELLQAVEERVTVGEIVQQLWGTFPHYHTGDEQWKENRLESLL